MTRNYRLRVAVLFLMAAGAILVVACSHFSLYGVIPAKASNVAGSNPLTINPVSPAVFVGGIVNFTASGGNKPYSFSVVGSGTQGTIDPVTGVYEAPSAGGSETVRVTDAAGAASDAVVTIVEASKLLISPATLTIGVGNTYQFGATGGVPPYGYSLFDPSGAASGSVTKAGLYTAPHSHLTDTVRVTDSVGATCDATVTVVSSGPLTISPSSPPDIAVPEGGTVTFTGSGGTPPYLYSIASGAGSGSIGVYSGIFTASGGVGAKMATVTLSDAATPMAQWPAAAIDIVPAAPTNLSASSLYPPAHLIELAWTNNSSGATAIAIERKVGNAGSWFTIATVGPSTSTYVDASAKQPYYLYVYRIQATAGSLASPYSNLAFAVAH